VNGGDKFMQDSFKYRLWYPYYGQMYYTDLYGVSELLYSKTIGRHDIKYAVMQCTGLKDKTGRLIYDGDIVTGAIGGTQQTNPWVIKIPDIYVDIHRDDGYLRVDIASLEVVGNR